MSPEEELQLVMKAKEDLSAFDSLYQYYMPKIYGYILARVLNKDVAEDLTSQVFLSSVEKIKKFKVQKGARYGSWLYRVANSKIIDYFRKRKMVDLEEIEGMIRSDDNTEKEVEIAFARIRIMTVLQKLKPRYQEIISLKYFSELEHDEIAETLELRKKLVAVVLHRALQSFREKYIKMYPESEIFDFI